LKRCFSNEIYVINAFMKNVQHFSHQWNVNQNYLWFCVTSVRKAVIMKTNTNKCWEDAGKGALIYCWCECKLVQSLWKSVCSFLKKKL
jgi:hypothetical protein